MSIVLEACQFVLELVDDEAVGKEDRQNVETLQSFLTELLPDVPEDTLVAICSQ